MKIKVASTNPQKIQAVKDLLPEYEILKGAEVEGVSVSSGVSDQPRTLEEIVEGSHNRARNAFKDCNLSFGMESGVVNIPNTENRFMDIGACAIYDGDSFKLGFSAGLEIPKKIVDFIDEHTDLSAACRKAGFTNEEKIGTNRGIVGLLSNNRIDRAVQLKQAIIASMIQIENKKFFE